ncbi:MAG: hypothetical protein RLZ92_1900 [Pseudomonadota bacterium]|jgi:uncharacterized protein (TIGR02646 family)
MRAITPSTGSLFHLSNAHANPPATDAQATSRWSSFGHKSVVLESLLSDQYGLCCYSELRADLEGLGYHIEHIQPKSMYPGFTFHYSNLAASALTSDDLNHPDIIQEQAFGGHARQSQYDAKFISCHDADCARYFAYLSDGRIIPSIGLNQTDTERAEYTIKLLNLDCPYLRNRRRRWFDELDQLFTEHQAKNWNLSDLASIDLIPTNHKLSSFFSLIRQFFGPIAENVLQQQAPQLL